MMNSSGLAIVLNAPGLNRSEVVARIQYSRQYEKSEQVDMTIGDIKFSVGIEDLRSLRSHTGDWDRAWSIPASLEGLRAAHAKLCAMVKAGRSCSIPVTMAGPGPTDKSVKIRVEGVVCVAQEHGCHQKTTKRSHTLTVPRSQIFDYKGRPHLPRWLVARTIHERILDGRGWPAKFENTSWSDEDQVWLTLWEPLIPLFEKLNQDGAAEMQRRAEFERTKPEREAQAELLRLERLKEKEADDQRNAQAAVAAAEVRRKRMDKLETIKVSRVEWDESEEYKNKYGNKSYRRVTDEAEDCTVKISGQRVYIIFEDGAEKIKALKNVRWTAAVAVTEQEATNGSAG